MKRTYIEIVRGLECCISKENCTKSCPYAEYKTSHYTCIELSTLDAVALIREQHSQIEKLKTKLNYFYSEEHIEQMQQEKKAIECYAIKHFAERLKERIADIGNLSVSEYLSVATDIDDLEKEMAGGFE